MSVKSADEYKTAARDKKPLKRSFDPAGSNLARTPEESFDSVVASARRFLQGFADLDNPERVRAILASFGFTPAIASVQKTSTMPNDDQAEEQKKEEERAFYALLMQINEDLRRLFEEQRELLEAWHKEKENNDRIKQEIVAIEQRMAELEKNLAKDQNGNVDWGKEAERTFGKDAAARRPGETEQEYQARMKELYQGCFDENGNLKAKYADDFAAKWFADEQKLIRLRKELAESNKKLEDLERRIADNARKIEEELAKKRELLEKRVAENENFLTRLKEIRAGPADKIDAQLKLFVQDRPGLDVKFDPEDNPEQRIKKVQDAIEAESSDIKREQVELEEQAEANREQTREVLADRVDKSEIRNDIVDATSTDSQKSKNKAARSGLTMSFSMAAPNDETPDQSLNTPSIEVADDKASGNSPRIIPGILS